MPPRAVPPRSLPLLILLAGLLLPALPAASAAQDAAAARDSARTSGIDDPGARLGSGGWNTAEVLDLVGRARGARADQRVDSAFTSYTSRANGYVYFFIDRPEDAERTLVKADQIALDVFWRAPDQAKQRIVGLRDEEVLPTNVRYHLDHLTVVQDEFGNLIRLGDGDEVAAVIHPMAPNSDVVYDFRMGDALTIDFGATREPVRVQEVQVRPKDLTSPGFVGSVFVDRATAAIVRMSFTFTPASYVDPYLDYIRISLDNSLWMERWWLPYRQEVELRREMPAIDFLAGSIIRGRFEIGGYSFNDSLPDDLFRSSRVSTVSVEAREAFDFERGLYDDIEEEGLAPSEELERIEEQVRSMAVREALGGLSPIRLHWPSVSDGLRRTRTEGWVTAVGTSFDLGEARLRLLGGWAFGAEEFQGMASLERAVAGGRAHLTGRLHDSRDLRPGPNASGVVNTIATNAGEDYTDLYRVSGIELGWRGSVMRRGVELRLRAEQESARTVTVGDEGDFRDAPEVIEGIRLSGRAAVRRDTRWGGNLELAGSVSRIVDEAGDAATTGTLEATAGWSRTRLDESWDALLQMRGLLLLGRALPQDAWRSGGRGTLPGYGYRDRSTDRMLLVRGELGRDLNLPWASVHLLAAAAWTDEFALPYGGRLNGPHPLDLRIGSPGGWRGSVGVGTDLLWEVLRLDLWRGLAEGGDWELVFSVRPDLAGWL